MATVTGGAGALNFDQLNLSKIQTGDVTAADATRIRFTYGDGTYDELFGSFIYTGAQLTGGTLTRASGGAATGAVLYDIAGFSLPVPTFVGFVSNNDNAAIKAAVLAGPDVITGTNAADVLRGYGGADVFVASPGADTVDGGDGADTTVFSGVFTSYTVTASGPGAWTVTDTRAGAPNGSVAAVGVETLQFADSTLTASTAPSAATVTRLETAFANVTRFQALASETPAVQTLTDGSVVTGVANTQRLGLLNLAASVDSGATSQTSALTTIARYADATTSVATLAYQFFTGKTPSAAGYDYLVHSTTNVNDLNDPYYVRFNLENRYINFAVNLGKFGDGAAGFTSGYGSLNLTQSLQKAYQVIFGTAASDAKAAEILNGAVTFGGQTATRADYFAAYGLDGANGIGTKAAMVGFLMAEAVKADTGTYAKANDVFLLALETGTGAYNVDLVSTYPVTTTGMTAEHDSRLS